ncbi:MAG: histone H1 [Cytophagales bacterium]|nr:histone H1 [Cytophagales bacterium]
MNRFDELKKLLDSVEADFKKFYEQNNQAAGTRIRKAMLELKNLAQNIRQHVQEIKNERNAKKHAASKSSEGNN